MMITLSNSIIDMPLSFVKAVKHKMYAYRHAKFKLPYSKNRVSKMHDMN